MTRREPPFGNACRRLAPILGAVVALAFVTDAGATICKYIDADGNIVYSNVAQGKNLRKLSCDIADDTPNPKGASSGAAKTPTPTGFPRVDADAQKSRDQLRRKVLEDELASEEKLLGEARSAYGNGAPPPLADEQNDAEKYRQRISRLRQALQLHERNIEALRKEIAAIR